MPKSVPQEFIEWLNNQMQIQGWGIRETARKANISHTSISMILGGGQPSFDTCVALAHAFGVSIIQTLVMAGLLTPPPEYSPTRAQWDDVFEKLPADDQQELLEIARLKLTRRRTDPGFRSQSNAA